MRQLPWHVAVRSDRRAVLTAVAVALGVSFCLLAFAIPDTLRHETLSPEGPFFQMATVVSRPGLVPFDASAAPLDQGTRVLWVSLTTLERGAIVAVAIEGSADDPIPEGEAIALGEWPGNEVTIVDGPTWSIRATRAPEPFATGASILVSSATLHALVPSLSPADASYVVLEGLDARQVEALRAQGLSVVHAPSVQPFFRQSALEIARDLFLVVVFSASLVVLFVYESMRSEVRERKREIGIWRGIGLSGRQVMQLLLGRAAAISASGALGGVVLSYLVLIFAIKFGGAGLASLRPFTALMIALAMFAAGIVGSLVPARTAARESVQTNLEGST